MFYNSWNDIDQYFFSSRSANYILFTLLDSTRQKNRRQTLPAYFLACRSSKKYQAQGVDIICFTPLLLQMHNNTGGINGDSLCFACSRCSLSNLQSPRAAIEVCAQPTVPVIGLLGASTGKSNRPSLFARILSIYSAEYEASRHVQLLEKRTNTFPLLAHYIIQYMVRFCISTVG